MKKSQITMCFLLPLFLYSGIKIMAQTNSISIQREDSIISERGDLNLLVERVYLAFKAYKTGIHEYNNTKRDTLQRVHLDSLIQADWLVNMAQIAVRPRPAIIKNGELVLEINDLNAIPVDSVQSIEVITEGGGKGKGSSSFE